MKKTYRGSQLSSKNNNPIIKIVMFMAVVLIGMYTLFYLYKKFHGYTPHQEFVLAANILYEIDKNNFKNLNLI